MRKDNKRSTKIINISRNQKQLLEYINIQVAYKEENLTVNYME
jgi:hypothetical protein